MNACDSTPDITVLYDGCPNSPTASYSTMCYLSNNCSYDLDFTARVEVYGVVVHEQNYSIAGVKNTADDDMGWYLYYRYLVWLAVVSLCICAGCQI